MHHYRRKSGHAVGNTSTTDVRRAVTASDPYGYKKPTRKVTPQSAPRLGKSPRDRERDQDDDRWWDEEGESFPQHCMVCGKQFVPVDTQSLYCTDACRFEDLSSSSAAPPQYSGHTPTHYPIYSGQPEPRDIVPRASPSRPNSTNFSPTTPAISALSALSSVRPSSPSSVAGTYHPNIWPFSKGSTTDSPNSSYTKPAANYFSSTWDPVYQYDNYGSSADRPLPSRRPNMYSRPKSIELVTPMMGR
ncbi:hypothetical protein QBC38DRAFT_258198 [Podospora fimiseda]|uniref:Life-span regulatory factor domain-containing protein n=1 Tax=Podospora fimiseda TaxID=252190 RepID=A0AAN7BLJ3_9PEZI|nr:hypothetical protein QBC38DRAFT_258198 [Podospora fimiseda]